MANVRVAVRVRPLSKRETKEGARIIVEVDDKVAKIRNLKVDSRPDGFGDSREKVVAFGFDYCYWSVNPEDPQYASQEVVFQDLGTEVLSGAAKGYNICLFAYGQTGSGKTYTMLGTPASVGLTPRICEGLFIREEDCASLPSSCNIKVSFLEIYNERVRDLLKQSDKKKSYTLRVREHPERGPYVQGLSEHVVTNYQQVIQLLEEGIANRITAATHVHEASSRSHAIFTVHYTQAILENSCPSEIASKINLVDLAGSERADPNYCKDRMTEGANINKSLVTLGIVISTLAQNSQMFSGCQILNSTASNGDCGIPSPSSGTTVQGVPSRRWSYIPYRDSVLTWLLKDSLGGNSKTVMVATVSPAHTSYNETMSTLRYASNAKSIINKPRVNEDANVKLIRELKEEIERLKAMLLSFELRNIISLNDEKDENLKELVLQNELKVDELIKDWAQKWDDWQTLMEHYSLDISKKRAGVLIDSSLPHLMALEDDVLSTGVVLYHLKEGTTKIGRIDSDQEQDIVLQGQWIERDHCTITSACGVVILRPAQGARCTVNGREVTAACRLTQGAVITLGKAHKFRFSHPAEAALLRQRRQVGEAVCNSGSLEWLDLDGDVTASRLGLCPVLWRQRKLLEEPHGRNHQTPTDGESQQQQHYVEDLRQQILAGQIQAEKEQESGQACVHQQTKGNQQWLLRQEPWLASLQKQQADRGAGKELEASVAPDAWLQTDLETPPSPPVRSQKRVVRLQFLRRLALRAAERSIWHKKASFHLERIIRNQRLQEAPRRLEQIRASCWLQDDSPSKSPCQTPLVPVPPHRSTWASCCSLGVERFCSQHLPQLHSVFLNWEPSTTLPPMPDPAHHKPDKSPPADPVHQAASFPPSIGHLCKHNLHLTGQGQLCWVRGASGTKRTSTPDPCLTVSNRESVDIQEVERVGQQHCQMASLGLMSVCQSVNKLKLKDRQKTLTPAIQIGSAKRLAASISPQAEWQKEWDLGTHKAAKGAICCPIYSYGPKQAAGHGKGTKTFQAKSKPTFPNRTTKRQHKILAARVRDIARQSFHLPHGNPLRRQPNSGNPDTMTALPDSSSVVDHSEKDNDLSDSESNYSVDSLSCACAEAQREPLKPEDPQGKWTLPEPENSESDNSQISEDSLAENGYQHPKELLRENHPINHDHPRTRTPAPLRGFCTPLDCSPCAGAHRSFSLDSLIDAEEELGEDQQEEPCLGSADEMPAETFWHLPNSAFPLVDQEATPRPGLISHRIEARLNAVLPTSSSCYLDPHFEPPCERPESEVETGCFEQAGSPQGTQLLRGSPLVSMDSWFSCDSKINPGSPLGAVGSLCSSPDIQEAQHSAEEKPGHRLTMEEPKPLGADAVLPASSRLPRGDPKLPCGARDVYPASPLDAPKLPAWEMQRLLHPGIFQGGEIPVITQLGGSEVSHNSSIAGVKDASAASFVHVGGLPERAWDTLQQKYLSELSHPVLDAVGELKRAFFCSEEDSSSLVEASDKKGDDTQLPVDPGVSSSVDVNNFLVHLSRTRHLRTEKDQVSSSIKLESASDLFTASDKEVSCTGAYSADVESLTSASVHAQMRTAANKVPHSVTDTYEGQSNSEECFQGSWKHVLTASSDEHFCQNKVCHSDVSSATKADDWLPDQALFRKNNEGQVGPLSQGIHPPLWEEKSDCQESSEKAGGRLKNVSFASPSVPELYLHSAPWNPFPTSLQPPPLETFYVTKSRDALTETALEIPAYREVQVSSPLPREAWGFHHSHQDLQEPHLEDSLSMSSQSCDPKMASFHQVTKDRAVDLCTREAIEKLEKCLGNIEESHSSVYCFFAHNRHHVPSTSTHICEFESQVGIVNIEHEVREKPSTQSLCSASLDSSGSEKIFIGIQESEAEGEEDQGPSAALLQAQACEEGRQSPSGVRSGFIHETTDLGLEKNMQLTTSAALKPKSSQLRIKMTMAQGNIPAHKWERKNETGLLGKALYPKDSPEEFKLPGSEESCERVQLDTCSQKRHPGRYKGPRRSPVRTNSKEPLGKTQMQNVTNADEMDKLIRSVRQLEKSILEIESQQSIRLRASHIPGVSKEFVSQDQKSHRRAGHILRPGSSGSHSSYEEPSIPRQIDDAIFGYGRAGGVEVHGDHEITMSSFRSSECAQDCQCVGVHAHTAGIELDTASSSTCDPSGRGTAHGECTNIVLYPGRMNDLARVLPTRLEGSGNDTNLGRESANSKEQTWDLESFEELETVKGFQKNQIAECSSSSEPEDPVVQGRLEQMARKSGRSPRKENNMVLIKIQKCLNPSQHCLDTVSSQETVSPIPTQTDTSTVTSHQDPRNRSLPLVSPRSARNHLHASDTLNTSSVDSLPTMLKIHNSPLGTRVGCQDQSGGTRISEGSVARGFSTPPTAWRGSEIPIPMGYDDQSITSDSSIPLGTEDWMTSSTSSQDPGRDHRITLVASSNQEDLGSETEAAVKRKRASSLSRISGRLEKKVSFLLEEDTDQSGEAKGEVEAAKDQESPSLAFSEPISLPQGPDTEPLLSDSSVHASLCLAILQEIRQVTSQRKQLRDFATLGTVLPYYEMSLEPECSLGTAGRCWQIDPLQVSDRTRNEGEAQGLSATPGHRSPDKPEAQATLLCEDDFQPLPDPEMDKGLRHHSGASSPRAAGNKGHAGEPRHFREASEQFVCHSDSETTGAEEAAPRNPSCTDAWASHRLSSALEWDKRGPSPGPCHGPEGVLQRQSHLAAWETEEGTFSRSWDNRPGQQESKSPESPYGSGSGSFFVTIQGGKKAHVERQPMVCDFHSASSPSGPRDDSIQGPEASTDLEEVATSAKHPAILAGALRKVNMEARTQQHVKWKEKTESMLAQACRTGSKTPRPTLPHPRPRPDPRGIGEEAPGLCQSETSDSLVLGSPEHSGPLGSSRREEESKTFPCQPLDSAVITANVCSFHSSPLPCRRDGDPRKGIARARRSPFPEPSRLCEMDEAGEGSSTEPDVPLARGHEFKRINVERGPRDSNTFEPSTRAAAMSHTWGCSSPFTPRASASSLPRSAADGRSGLVGDSEKKGSRELNGLYSESLRTSTDSSVGDRHALASDMEPESPVTSWGLHSPNGSRGFAESELAVEEQHRLLENSIRSLLEKRQPITKSLDPQATFVGLNHGCSPQVDCGWEEEEQQRDEPSGGGEAAPGRNPPPSDEGGLCRHQVRDAGRAEVALRKGPVSQSVEDTASVPLEQTEVPQPAPQRPGQSCCSRKQPAPQHRHSHPIIAVFSAPQPRKSSPRPSFSVISSSRSLQELTAHPSPREEDTQSLRPSRRSSRKPMARACPRAEDGNQTASSNSDSSPADHRAQKPAIPPYPASPTHSCMPTPSCVSCCMYGTLEQPPQGKPEKPGAQVRPENCSPVDKGMSTLDCNDSNPSVPPSSSEGSVCIGWKQYVFGSTADLPFNQKQSTMAHCTSVDNGLEDPNSPLDSQLSAHTRILSSVHSSSEHAQSWVEAGKVPNPSFSLRDPYVLTGTGVAPTSATNRRLPCQACSDVASCPQSELLLAEEDSAAPVEEACPGERRLSTLEQGTQTLGCRLRWSCTDISTQPDSDAVSACDLASWSSMHSLSVHLSQLLHSTSQLLGSLSQPNVAPRKHMTKVYPPQKAPEALRTEGGTQTTVDKDIQTDLISPLLPVPAPGAKAEEVNAILEVLAPDRSQGKDTVPVALEKRETEETPPKMAASPDLHEESPHLRLRSPPRPSSQPRLKKGSLEQSLPSVSPMPPPEAALAPASQPGCPGIANSPSIPPSPGLFPTSPDVPPKPRVQKPPGPGSAMVDRATSPILTFRASSQESGPPLGSLALSAPSSPPLEGHPKPNFSPHLVLSASRLPMENCHDQLSGSQSTQSQGLEQKHSERSPDRLLPEASSPQQSSSVQAGIPGQGQCPGQLQPVAATEGQSRQPSPPPSNHRSADNLAYAEPGSLSSGEPRQCQGSAPAEPLPTSDPSSSWRELSADTAGPRGPASASPHACQPEKLPRSTSEMCLVPELQHHSWRDRYGVQDDSSGALGMSEELRISSRQKRRRPPQLPDESQNVEWSQTEQIPLQMGVRKPSLSTELTEAKLHRGFGEAEALLQVLQSGTGEALAPEPLTCNWEELYARQRKAIETLRKERAERLQHFYRMQSLRPKKLSGFQLTKGRPTPEPDLPSRRREYLQQLRKEVVETTRRPEQASRSAGQTSDIELMLRDYQRAREEAKVEIARARDQLRERTEQEKMGIRQKIISQLLREEEKLHTLVSSSPLCTSSNGSLSSGITSGYNSSPACSGQPQSPEALGDTDLSDSRDTWTRDGRGRPASRSSHPYVAGSACKSSGYSLRATPASCCSQSSLSSLVNSFSAASYQDLAKHIMDMTMADVMAACSDNLHNLFSCQATAGWNYQGEEQKVQVYYKEFSSTRHGFLGAGVVSQPLPHVWAAVSDPTLWPLYHKPIQTARLHQRVTNSISLVYLVCDTTLCALKQPRDFCCVCVEAKEGHLSIMAAQSVYDTSMPRPSKKMVRGEILPSAWILQPFSMEGKDITRVVFLAQVELGAPGFPPHLLSSFIKQQPLVVAKLASFLGS